MSIKRAICLGISGMIIMAVTACSSGRMDSDTSEKENDSAVTSGYGASYEIVPVAFQKNYEIIDFWGDYINGAYATASYTLPSVSFSDTALSEIENKINDYIMQAVSPSDNGFLGNELEDTGIREFVHVIEYDYKIFAENPGYLSLIINLTEYEANDKENSFTSPINMLFDLRTGEAIEFGELFSSKYDFKEYFTDLEKEVYMAYGWSSDYFQESLGELNCCSTDGSNLLIMPEGANDTISVPLDDCAAFLNEDGLQLLGYDTQSPPKSRISEMKYQFYRYLADSVVAEAGWSNQNIYDIWTPLSSLQFREGLFSVHIDEVNARMVTVQLVFPKDSYSYSYDIVLTLYTLEGDSVVKQSELTLSQQYYELENMEVYAGDDYICFSTERHNYDYEFDETYNASTITLVQMKNNTLKEIYYIGKTNDYSKGFKWSDLWTVDDGKYLGYDVNNLTWSNDYYERQMNDGLQKYTSEVTVRYGGGIVECNCTGTRIAQHSSWKTDYSNESYKTESKDFSPARFYVKNIDKFTPENG